MMVSPPLSGWRDASLPLNHLKFHRDVLYNIIKGSRGGQVGINNSPGSVLSLKKGEHD